MLLLVWLYSVSLLGCAAVAGLELGCCSLVLVEQRKQICGVAAGLDERGDGQCVRGSLQEGHL